MIMENKTSRIRAISFLLYQQLYEKGTLNFSTHQEGRIKKVVVSFTYESLLYDNHGS